MLKKELPFYRKRGTIASIEELDKYYLVKLYELDGSIKKYDFNIKKTLKNKEKLFDNYYCNVEEYLNLTSNKEKYTSLKEEEKKNQNPLLNKKLVAILLSISILVGITPLASSIVLNSGLLWTIGKYTLVIGAAFSTASIISLKNIKNNKESTSFTKIYENLKKDLELYNEEKDKELTPKKRKRKDSSDTLSPISRELGPKQTRRLVREEEKNYKDAV
jgi:hypothetical protein